MFHNIKNRKLFMFTIKQNFMNTENKLATLGKKTKDQLAVCPQKIYNFTYVYFSKMANLLPNPVY